uniref:transmembrane protein 87A-like isoform X2 n=1 Tax=Myxine glutinosa TaxID=7769 RepID=UPI00358E77CD
MSPDRWRWAAYLTVLCCGLHWSSAAAQPGRWTVVYTKTKNVYTFYKTMFNNTDVIIGVPERHCIQNATFMVRWVLIYTHCYNNINNIEEINGGMYDSSMLKRIPQTYPVEDSFLATCDNLSFRYVEAHPVVNATDPSKKKKDIPQNKDKQPEKDKGVEQKAKPSQDAPIKNLVTRTWRDGPFLLFVEISSHDNPTSDWKLHVEVQLKNKVVGYISAAEWPLMTFYMVLCILYVLLGVVWLVCLARYWRDLLRIQFWIGAVILLGMVEKAVFYAEFHSINMTGLSVHGAVVFAELVSAVKRTLARLLVIIVSLGYGIVKPRLGNTMYKVVGVGLLYMIFSAVEGVQRVSVNPNNIDILYSGIILAFIDSCIIWWIFMSLYQTMKTLTLRRNVVKLSLYRHFTNTLVFCVLASIIFTIWSTRKFRFAKCQSDWQEIWLEEAFWRLLFSVILVVIMVLWRPSVNNQRYAFTPLLDEEDDEEEEPMINEAFEGVKMRGVKQEANGSTLLPSSKAEDDLKWVEDNIPVSMAEVAFPALLDSDEEIMTTKFEMSKME